ncbi:MAG: DUF952 domain-containing protein [Chloroflexi bacterium]|nr:DUF952 domain-containing protein [Chloroflexota bacterium]
MTTIFHITTSGQWEQAQMSGEYRGDTLDTEGFIHCSTATQVVRVANALFRGRHDLVLLCIDTDRLQPELRYDEIPGGERFPHLYGRLNAGAVVKVTPFKPDAGGTFRLPEDLAKGA